MKIFPTYSTVVETVFGQVLSNHLFEQLSVSMQVKAHAEFVNAIHTLIPNSGKIEFELNGLTARCDVEIKDNIANTLFNVRITADMSSLDMRTNVV